MINDEVGDRIAIRNDRVLFFPGNHDAPAALAGGKGHGLIRLANRGLTVPPGAVLTTRFFAPWVESLLATAEWQSLLRARRGQWPSLCDALQQRAGGLSLDASQEEALELVRRQLAGSGTDPLFAVRSSSAQEDLQGASFAGGYRTCLGVRPADLVDAVRRCFASLFDERVIAYKVARGLDLDAPGMAVVIQEQIASEVAGVAFSINPLNNDYDEAVVDANWGLGETVVAGDVTPDHWVLDKTSGEIIQRHVHDKHLSRRLQPDGVLVDETDSRGSRACLTDDELGRLLALLDEVERHSDHPVDIEWAIAEGRLYLLQARPVTACVPLPASLATEPGRRRRLYMDIAQSSGFTINAPISAMGLGVSRRLIAGMGVLALGKALPELAPEDAMIHFAGGRMYADMSNAMWLAHPRRMARDMELSDARMARLLKSIDPKQYRSGKRPSWARLRMLRMLPGMLWRLRRALGNLLLPFVAPERMHRRITQRIRAWEHDFEAGIDQELPLPAFWDRYVTDRLRTMIECSLPTVGTGVFAVAGFSRLAGRLTGSGEDLLGRLDRGFDGNVVVGMSVAMSRLAKQLGPEERVDVAGLARRLSGDDVSPSFLREWRAFIRQYGCRGPLEMDIAHPRYGDAPEVALRQIAAMPADDEAFDPAAAWQRQVRRRREAVAEILGRAGPVRRRILKRLHQVIERFAGLRDHPKQYMLMILHDVRRRIVIEGERLHARGRLDAPEHVFDLDFDELVAAADDPGLDLRSIRAGRRAFHARLEQVVNFPPMIDSRGRIPRPPVNAARDGVHQGIGLSPGIVSGPARVLKNPHDKPLARGDVLIAYATDPGWTPLFANAVAVVLEVGGALQHGAVVARELGLPCVAGIDGITTAFEDGDRIEVDGDSGSVRVLDPNVA